MSDQETIGPNDDFDDPRPGMSRRAKLFGGGAILIGVVVLGAVGWLAFQEGMRSGVEEAPPVVRASPEPIKRKPANAGGLNVPHQGKLVWTRLVPEQVNEPVEHLLPPPEEPNERPVMLEVPSAVEVLPERPESKATANILVDTPPPELPMVTASSNPLIAKTPLPPEAEIKPVAKSARKQAAINVTGGWKIQLASVSSKSVAENEWKRMRSGNTDILGKLLLNVQTIKLDRGTFYRIQAGPLVNRAAAGSLCGKLKVRKQDCLVVAP
jgi:cell division septation protein DedD